MTDYYNQLNSIEQLLDSNSLLELGLVRLLESSALNWVSTKEVSDSLQINVGASLRIIEKFNEDIQLLNVEGIAFSVSKGKGVRLSIKSDKDIKMITSFIISRSPIIQLFDSIFKEEVRSVTQYAQENYISEATVRRHINKIRSYLEVYNISISRVRTTLEGDEKQIRMVMMIFYWRIYGGLGWPFDSVDENDVKKVTYAIIRASIKSEVVIPFIFVRRMEYYFAEAILRSRKKNLLSENDPKLAVFASGDRYQHFKDLLERHSYRIINTSEPEVAFHYATALSSAIVYYLLKPITIEKFITDHTQRETPIAKATEIALEEMENYFSAEGIQLSLNNDAKWELFCVHSFAYLFKGFNSDMNGLVYNNYFSNQYPSLMKNVATFIDSVYVSSKNEIFLEKEFLLVPYVQILLRKISPVHFEKKVTVIVECDVPKMVENHIVQSILFYFRDKYNLQFLGLSERYRNRNIDVVITTMAVEELQEYYSKSSIIRVKRELLSSDFHRLDMLFKKIVRTKLNT